MFTDGREEVKYDERFQNPAASRTDKTMKKPRQIIREDSPLNARMIFEAINSDENAV